MKALVLLLAVAGVAHADYEATAVDITQIKMLRADQVTVFGVKLGMTHAEAEAVLKANPKLVYKRDSSNPDRIYVNGAAGGELFYLVFEPKVAELNRISIFRDLGPQLVGRTRQLITVDAITPTSSLYKDFLGAPTSSKVTLDIESIHLKHTTFWYAKRWLAITQQQQPPETDHVVFALERPQYAGPGNATH